MRPDDDYPTPDVLTGGAGDDLLVGGPGVVAANRGGDLAHYRGSPRGVRVHLGSGRATGWGHDVLKDIEAVVGSDHADRLSGDRVGNELFGRGGQDRINGRRGRDVLQGDAGPDRVLGWLAYDILFGDQGNDRLVAGKGGDRKQYAGDELYGGRGDDAIVGNAASNNLFGESGDDVVRARGGRDVVAGDDGHDRLFGGGQDDRLNGGSDWDTGDGGPHVDGDRCTRIEVATRCEL